MHYVYQWQSFHIGYQRELTYKHKDDSYSVFGRRDKSGSTWLVLFIL